MSGKSVLLLAGLLSGLCATAAPFAEWFDVSVRTGGTVRLWGEGDEYSASFETESGYAVRFDPSRLAYFYLVQEADGSLVFSDLELGASGAAEAIAARVKPHLRDMSEKARAERLERIRRDDEESGRAARWAKLKQTTRRIREAKKKGLLMAPPSTPTVGTVKGLTILVDFPVEGSNKTLWEREHKDVTVQELTELLNGEACSHYGNYSSVRGYYADVSNGRLDYTMEVIGPILAPQPRSHYDDVARDNGECARELIGDVLKSIWSDENFSTKYLPLLRSLTAESGYVLSLNFWFAGPSATEWSQGLWAHKWVVGSEIAATYKFTVGGKTLKFRDYQITPIKSTPSIYTFCHENGHMLCGFPDLYAYEKDELGVKGQGVGYFSLMKGSLSDTNPPFIDPYLRAAAGWIEPQILPMAGGVMTVRSNHTDVWKYENPLNPNEYYLIENRQKSGRDSGIPASGILIWRCDESGDNTTAKGLSGFNEKVRRVSNELSLEQADGKYELEKGTNYGNARDLWYSANSYSSGVFNDDSLPTARWSDVTASGLNLSDFSANGVTMTFRVADYSAIFPDLKFTTGVAGLPSKLFVSSVTGNKSTAYPKTEFTVGDPILCTFGVSNGGKGKSGAIKALLTLYDSQDNALSSATVSYSSGLDGGYWIGRYGQASGLGAVAARKPGVYRIVCTLDPDGAMRESNEDNNTAECTFTVVADKNLPQAVDADALEFASGGDACWFSQDEVTSDGIDAVRSGVITDSQDSWIQTTVTGPGTLTFDWLASSESVSYDYLEFLVDDSRQAKIGGEGLSWASKTYSIGAGVHTLRWNYHKDYSMSGGSDAGYLDRIVWTPQMKSPVIGGPEVAVVVGSLDVAVSCATAGAVVRYTMDRTDPTEASPAVQGGKVTISGGGDVTLKVRAFKDGLSPSVVVSARYLRKAEPGEWISDVERMKLSAADNRLACVLLVGKSQSALKTVIFDREFLDWAAANEVYLLLWDYEVDNQSTPVASFFKTLSSSAGEASLTYTHMFFAKAPDWTTAVGKGVATSGYKIGEETYKGTVSTLIAGFKSILAANGLLDPFPPVTPVGDQTEAEAVAAELAATFGADSEVVSHITTQAKLAEFNAFVKSCGILSATDFPKSQLPYAYSSFVLSSILENPMLLEVEPKLEITSSDPANGGAFGGWDFTVSLDIGSDDLPKMVAEKLGAKVRVGTDVNDITHVPQVIGSSAEKGNPLTLTIAKPGEKSGFIRVRVER